MSFIPTFELALAMIAKHLIMFSLITCFQVSLDNPRSFLEHSVSLHGSRYFDRALWPAKIEVHDERFKPILLRHSHIKSTIFDSYIAIKTPIFGS